MEIKFDVNMEEVKKFADKLGNLHRSAYPSAVRSTLNFAAFDVKTRTMPESSRDSFVQRSPNFFKANSRVKKAMGWNVNDMKSIVGFVPLKGNNHAVNDLEQQERGGKIEGRSFIPMRTGRVGKSTNKNVRKQNRISQIKNIINAADSKGKTEGVRFVKAAIHAGVGGNVLSERGVLWRIDSIIRKNGRSLFKMTPIHSFKQGRDVSVKSTHFMRNAAEKSAKKMPEIFNKEAEFQFSKHLR